MSLNSPPTLSHTHTHTLKGCSLPESTPRISKGHSPVTSLKNRTDLTFLSV